VHEAATEARSVELTPTGIPLKVNKIGMVGLGQMGFGMASSLLRAGFTVCGYDVHQPSLDRFLSAGNNAKAASSPSDAASGADVLILMVQNATQVEDVLFGSGNAAEHLSRGSVVILNSTVPPSFVRSIDKRLVGLDKNIGFIDGPVSGGVARALKGDLTIICSGSRSTISGAHAVLIAMSGQPKNLYHVQGGVGAASSVKLINQLLAGVHIVSAAEAMAFSARLGLDTRSVFDIIKTAAGNSWMFENRVPAMLAADWTPNSALAIFVKDLGIVLDEAKRLRYPVPMASAAHQLYLFAAANGWATDADSGVVRVWEKMTGVSVSASANTTTSTTID
jgi:3-hydroxyisobutyrate dehydrogenase-like beta-hydroxyacid dehydrogenase